MTDPTDDMIAMVGETFQTAGLGLTSWTEALEALARITGSTGAQLCGLGADDLLPFNLMTGVPDEAATDFVASGGGDARINSRVRIGIRARELQVLDESDFSTEADMRMRPEYGEWIRRYDTHNACLTTLTRSPGVMVGLALIRNNRQGNVGALERKIFGTLAIQARAGARLQLALQHQGGLLATGLLEAVGAAAFLCDARGRVMAMTPAAEALVASGDILRLQDRVLAAVSFHERDPLEREIGAAVLGLPRAFQVLRGAEGEAALIVEATRVPSTHSPTFGAEVVVVAHVARADQQRLAQVGRALFGFSEAEAAIAAQLASGRSPAAIAHDRRVSPGTVRSQIRGIYAKACVTSQLELAARLPRI